MRTPARELANVRTDGRLDEIVERYRSHGVTWANIARVLKADHGVEVTDVTLVRWFGTGGAA